MQFGVFMAGLLNFSDCPITVCILFEPQKVQLQKKWNYWGNKTEIVHHILEHMCIVLLSKYTCIYVLEVSFLTLWFEASIS